MHVTTVASMRYPPCTLSAGLLAFVLGWPAGAAAQDTVLYSDDFEDRPEVNVQVRGANQPYTTHTIGLTQEKAHIGKTSVKVDITTMHGFEVQLAPRTNARPGVEWGSLGGAGEFSLPGLDIPIQGDRGYLLEARVWVEKTPSEVRIDVATVSDSPYDYVKYCLDRAADYGIKYSPSTFVTRHYDKEATAAQAEAAMRKLTGMVGDHPALLAYWLVDEPSGGEAPDFFWGKRLMESTSKRPLGPLPGSSRRVFTLPVHWGLTDISTTRSWNWSSGMIGNPTSRPHACQG